MNFDFERFKEETRNKSSLMMFAASKEYDEFMRYLKEHNIKYIPLIESLGTYCMMSQVYWCQPFGSIVGEVHITQDFLAPLIFMRDLILFRSSEEELLDFLKK